MSDESGCQCEKCGAQVSITAILCKKCNKEEEEQMGDERGFFCCNKKYPKRFIEAGFIIGPAMPTRFCSSSEIELDGYVGIWTKRGDIEAAKRYTDMTGFPIPTKDNQMLFLLPDGVNEDIDETL